MKYPERKIVLKSVEEHIKAQVESKESVDELKAFGTSNYDWLPRVRKAISIFLPAIVELAPQLVSETVKPFNCSFDLREELKSDIPDALISNAKEHDERLASSGEQWLKSCRDLSNDVTSSVNNIESQQLSAEAQRFLISDEGMGELIKANGGSIYPDLILADFDYSFLNFQSRKNPIDGPCLKNMKDPKPSNVPDGCEIKTNRSDKIKVDAHGAHPGLHLGITWGFNGKRVEISGIWVAYIRIADYSISNGSVDVTTKKRSFGHGHFISALTGEK